MQPAHGGVSSGKWSSTSAPLPARGKSRVMAAFSAMLAAIADGTVDAASVREVFFS